MNCSEAARLGTLLSKLLQELQGNSSTEQPRPKEEGGDAAYLYILLIMIFYACLAGALILAYTRSRKQESKHDPYHVYIEREWSRRGQGARSRSEHEELLGAAAAAGGPLGRSA